MRRTLPDAALLAAALALPAAASAAVSPPPPTGPAPVGYQRLTLTDDSRPERVVPGGGPRRVVVRTWYPAARPGAAPAATLTDAEQGAWEGFAGLAPGALDGLGSDATVVAPPAGGRHPVLLLSHGGGSTTAMHTAHAADLASHGYVVVGIDHPGDALAVDLGDRAIAPANPALNPSTNRSYDMRVRDARFVLGRLRSLRGAGRLDLSRIGAFGHSVGGATAAGLMLADRRVDAGVDIDGSLRGRVVRRGLDRPFGIVVGRLGTGRPLSDYGTVVPFRSRLRGPRPLVTFPGSGHHAFTDEVWLVPQLGLDPVAAEVGTVDPATAVRQQRAWLLRFFDRHVRGA